MNNIIHTKEGWMKHPFWIANSILFILVMFVFGFIYFFRAQLPQREDIEPVVHSLSHTEQILQVNNISKVYENDLFGTYKKEIPKPITQDLVQPLPQPPLPKKVVVPDVPEPQFLDPLDITLKGIIAVNIDSSKNRTIIQENKTKQESIYKVGDAIEDARLIRILSNKVIVLRSNGQQEVLYLREKDAQSDPAYMIIDGWDKVIQHTESGDYLVNTKEFIERINNLGQFIDMLGLTTAYKKGMSIGLAIGQMDEKALGPQLGLQSGDIIVTVNDMPATDVQSRLHIYKNIIAMKEDDIIRVSILRSGQEYEMAYTIKSFGVIAPSSQEAKQEHEQKKQKEANSIESLGKKHNFAPTVQEIRRRERRNMLRKGKEENHKSSTSMSAE